jgi:hypothetical protein
MGARLPWRRQCEGFGAKGNGVADDTAAIQAAIDAVTGSANPATQARIPIAAVYVPRGDYIISSKLVIRSVQGFRLFGEGPEITRFVVKLGTALDALLEIDGAAHALFENFSTASDGGIVPGSGEADKMIYVHWSGPLVSYRSTTDVVFVNVHPNGRYRVGFAVGTDDGTKQCDGVKFYNCVVTGYWSVGEANYWQRGYEFGSGATGNCIDHVGYGIGWSAVRYGAYVNASSLQLYGVHASFSEVHIWATGASGPVTVNGMRFESGGRLLYYAAGTAASRCELRNCDFTADALAADGQWIVFAAGGVLVLENVLCYNEGAAAGTAVIYVHSPGFASGFLTSCIATGVSSQTVFANAFTGLSGVTLRAQNYHQLDSSGRVIAVSSSP